MKEIRKQNNYSQVNTNSLFDFCPEVQDKLCCIYIFGGDLRTEQDRWTLARMELFYGNKCILNYQRLHQPNHHHQAKAPRTMIASGEGRIMCSYSSVFANRRRIKRMSFCYRLFSQTQYRLILPVNSSARGEVLSTWQCSSESRQSKFNFFCILDDRPW